MWKESLVEPLTQLDSHVRGYYTLNISTPPIDKGKPKWRSVYRGFPVVGPLPALTLLACRRGLWKAQSTRNRA